MKPSKKRPASGSVTHTRIRREVEQHRAIEVSEKRVVEAAVLTDRDHVAPHIMIVDLMAPDMCVLRIANDLGRLKDQ